MQDEGFHCEFRINHGLQAKPQMGEPLQQSVQTNTFGPGSDLALVNPDLILANINNTHLLVANLYCVYRPQLLLLTKNTYRRQHEPLDADDLGAAQAVLVSTKHPYYAMFNCSAMAGASREHKHMHILPLEDESSDPTEMPPLETRIEKLPFQSFRSPVEGDDPDQLVRVYNKLLVNTREALGLTPGVICPHNVILTQEWIMLIPRQSNNFHGITSNSAGMIGSIWLQNETQLEKWTEFGPRKVLSHLGIAKY
ncbi:phosphorylase, putative [Talaromyces islandicus]|uniref:Phosphorylase, putative n=1 Tax=Talaromyces islandicus TaxID=28573 RepID=A0A0U1LUQ5_TALIS|nr:phosphorylase, putative [Talaromyces islandicus]